MMSSLVANPVASSDRSRDSRRKKKKKAQVQSRAQESTQPSYAKWKSESQQQIYSSKLVQALSQVRLGDTAAPPRGRAVREAADRALAYAAKGRTRWSRAILTNRIKLSRFRKQRRQRSASAMAALTGSSRSKKPRVSVHRLKGKSLPAVQKKVKVLGRLVPGCRKEPLPVILDEATDYIAALEMQVRAMSALARLLSGDGSSSSSVSELPPSG
ncbi:hypothetical protein CDL15_Pgr011219 [Punica granatum]|uniref:IBH1-like N-terminal domain-containing protein n=1 Tax=Punica granatum TaxID=22663 RepID=A0A218WGD6_PUNGR|nr:hypothetical protein CDL15_Pgr011219 [Punica granatum]